MEGISERGIAVSGAGRVTDLYLVRHAIAEPRDPASWPEDSQRPLTPRGIARFQSAARGLSRIVTPADVVLASPYERAWETAEILHADAGWPAPEHCSALEAIRPPGKLLEVLRARADFSSAALVGHEPFLSRLASLLLCGTEDALQLELKKGGIALLHLSNGVASGEGLLRWSLSPKILRSLDASARK